MRRSAPALALAALALALWGGGTASAAVELTLPSGFKEEIAFENLDSPTNFRFAPDGAVFVAQKNGEIKYFPPGSGPGTVPSTFADLRKQTYDQQDRGLLGLALDPKFAQGRPYVYALYTFDHELGQPFDSDHYPKYGTAGSNYEGEGCPTEAEGCVVSGRLVKLTATGLPSAQVAAPGEEVLLEGWCQQYLSHSVGDLEFGPEGALYVSGGDGASYNDSDYGQFGNPCGDPPKAGGSMRSQSVLRPGGPTLLNGTLLRIDPDTGKGWTGNPFAGSGDENAERIAAFGFRNPFRFTLDPVAGVAYVDNVGNSDIEEIDRFPFGAGQAYNSGWPCFEGNRPNWPFQIASLPGCEALYESPGSTSAPFFQYDHHAAVVAGDKCPTNRGSAISGTAIYDGTAYPAEYRRALFFADSVRGCIWAMFAGPNGEPDPSKVVPFLSEQNLSSIFSVYPGVDIEPGPGGDLYFAGLYPGRIYRIAYDPGAPKPELSVDKEWGPAPLRVKFDAGGSSAVAGHALAFRWDLDGDGQFDDATGPTAEYEYTDGTKNVEVKVEVEDTVNGKKAVARKKIYPGDTPPTVRIVKPTEGGLTWGVGQKIQFEGEAETSDGTPLPDEDLAWETRLLHCPQEADHCHEHPLQTFRGTDAGEFPAPVHEFPSYIKFFLKATDARGLSAEATQVQIAARPVTLRIESVPAGIPIAVAQEAEAAPFERQVVEGAPTTLSAPYTAMVGGVEYRFKGWSDGGAASHVVQTAGPGTFVAEYVASAGPPAPPSGSGDGRSNPPPPAVPKPPKLNVKPGRQTTKRMAKFAFGAAGAPAYQCRLDKKKWAACRSPRTYRGLAPGAHTFRVRAAGADGSPLTKATAYGWKVVGG
jgi:glucose/arabinose dehydrogenase